MSDLLEVRQIKKNGKTAYISIPRQFIKAMNLPIDEVMKLHFVFRMRNGKPVIEIE